MIHYKRKIPHKAFCEGLLRRGRDSNSWYGYPYGSLANCWFQPLTHLSGMQLNYFHPGGPDVDCKFSAFCHNYNNFSYICTLKCT